jgi:predicted nucleic acid-binding protein
LTVFDIHYEDVLEAYGQLSMHWERAGKRMEQNDLWIAASAQALDAVLLTADGDFRKLEKMIQVEWVDPELLKGLKNSAD